MSPAHSSESIDLDAQESVAIRLVDPPPTPDERGSGGIGRKLLVLLIIVSVAGFVAWKIRSNLGSGDTTDTGRKQPTGDHAVPVITTIVQQKTVPIYVTALGTATAYYSVTIKSRVDGQLTAVTAREGQKVRRGQLVAQIDPAPYAAALAQAEGQIAKDKAAASYANKEADRYTSLFNAGVVSQDSQQSFAASAGQIAGAIQADQAAIQAAKVNLDYTRIASPIDGVVGLRQVDPGNIVHASDATGLLLITQLQPISVIFTLPEDQLPAVQQLLSKRKTLAVEAYDRSQSSLLATGRLLTLDNLIDTATGTDKVKATFDNNDGALFPNQFVNVRLILHRRPDAIVIPSAAVQTGTQGNFVYVVKKGDPPKSDAAGVKTGPADAGTPHRHADDPASAAGPENTNTGDKSDSSTGKPKFYVELRPIVIDLTEEAQVIVSSGLAAGEQVVIDGMEKLRNGSRVAPAKDATKSGRASTKAGDSPADAVPKLSDAQTTAGGDDAARQHHHHGPQP
jgi:multidrug efflux system membrane fusion protein